MKYVYPQSYSPQPHCHQVIHHHIDENPPKVCTKVPEDVCKERVEKKCRPAKCDYSVSFNVVLFRGDICNVVWYNKGNLRYIYLLQVPPVCEEVCLPRYMCKVLYNPPFSLNIWIYLILFDILNILTFFPLNILIFLIFLNIINILILLCKVWYNSPSFLPKYLQNILWQVCN